ncbi:cyclophilin-like fold protein [Bacteroides faecichinchillae]|uniref:cyclophilin-like fold protein n=1 Tax=Bacteroides faecichinchillae TaxID=871325 RepID=UPI0035146C6E
MAVDMSELNRNEKYYYLSEKLSTSSSAPGTMHAGDLMFYGNNCIVLFMRLFLLHIAIPVWDEWRIE